MAGTFTWNMTLGETGIMVDRMCPGLYDKLRTLDILNIYGVYDFDREELTLNMSMKVNVPDKYKKHFKKVLVDNATSDNNDCTATAEIQPSPKSPDGDFVQS